ncbi:MAG: D-alanine--D-alanine ligase family protein [Bacillota bacterium]
MGKLKVALIFGGRSPEHEISVLSASSVYEAADRDKYEFVPVGISRDGFWVPPHKARKVLHEGYSDVDEVVNQGEMVRISESLNFFLEEDFNVVFPLLHGPNGEDGYLQGFMEMIDLPYVGTGVLSSGLGMDKVFMKKIFAYHSLPQADYLLYRSDELNDKTQQLEKQIEKKLGYPCFVKPANMGSSIGISRVESPDQVTEALKLAFKYDDKLVIEENIAGREIECSVLGGRELKASLPGEIKSAHKYYDYQAKYEDEATELIIPAPIPEDKITELKKLACEAFRVIDGYGMCRVDFFYNQQTGKIYINELNTIPGFTEYSMYPKLWDVSGLDYSDLIDELIALALNK